MIKVRFARLSVTTPPNRVSNNSREGTPVSSLCRQRPLLPLLSTLQFIHL